MAQIRNSRRLDQKLGAFARGNDITPIMMLAGEITREAYIEKLDEINGVREEVRYGPKRTVTVSDPGKPPNTDTGNLKNRTEVMRLGQNVVEVASNADYAEALELGTDKMAARPALGPAYDETLKRVIAAIAKGIARQIRTITNGGA